MAWKKTKIKNTFGRTITVWKNEKGQISYSNPKAVKAAKTAIKISGIDKGLSGIRDIASFTRASLQSGGGSRSGQFLGGYIIIPKYKEKADLSPKANQARILAEKNRITQAENEAKLEGLRIDRRSGNNIRTGTRNWLKPARTPEYERDAKARKELDKDIKKYQEGKVAAAEEAAASGEILQHRRELGMSTSPGMTEWTTDQDVDESGKKLTGEFYQEPEFKSDGTKSKKTSSKKSGNGSSSGNNSNFKSDVFTINPETGKAVGVLTRSQRRAFEKKYGDKLDKLKIRSYTNKGDTYKRYG